jgi:hypothetical protein
LGSLLKIVHRKNPIKRNRRPVIIIIQLKIHLKSVYLRKKSRGKISQSRICLLLYTLEEEYPPAIHPPNNRGNRLRKRVMTLTMQRRKNQMKIMVVN